MVRREKNLIENISGIYWKASEAMRISLVLAVEETQLFPGNERNFITSFLSIVNWIFSSSQ